ncbi:hypothetical protein BDN70DRAFT_934163 [Pholiota conissans]|uniref:Pyridoxamine 5'-phosphate oxidase N-terminal domain-containing protein n=1 Tax=Pholiota conissans TaxID=109636 RepID=A0A9P5YYI9_9AGAR|nr:hypothetical protein BDN70DRAFT_934163 [Pholiota conissans]
MGQFLEEIPQYLVEWILKQQMFWVASAPLSPDGHVNISPKAIEGTFHVVDSHRVWYEDLSGSGAETVAHIRENGRVTILFHAFDGPARIVRLYGKGFFHELGSPEYDRLVGSEKRLPGSRAIIGLDICKVGTTCGYAVPFYKFIGHRTQLINWAAKKESNDQKLPGIDNAIDDTLAQTSSSSAVIATSSMSMNPNGMKQWWQSHNLLSLDGLPAFSVNLGKGFSFGVKVILPRIEATSHATHSRLSGIDEISSTTDANSQMVTARKYLFHIGRGYCHCEIRYHDLSFILPYMLTLVVGVYAGRFYEYYLIHGSLALQPISYIL